jgi:hypothetical protein
MDDKNHIRQKGPAKGKLRRLERELERVKRDLNNTLRNRTIGGVTLVLGLVVLIGFFVWGNQLIAFIAISVLLIGGWVFIKTLLKINRMRHSIVTITDHVTNARTTLAEIETGIAMVT